MYTVLHFPIDSSSHHLKERQRIVVVPKGEYRCRDRLEAPGQLY